MHAKVPQVSPLTAITFAIALLACPAGAEDMEEAGGYVTVCTNATGTLSGMCAGYAQGMRDMMVIGEAAGAAWSACVPAGVSDQERVSILARYIGKDPSRARLSTGFAYIVAMAEAFPCTANAPGR